MTFPAPAPRPSAGSSQLGPCARCQTPTPKYGSGTGPLCAECRAKLEGQVQ